MRPNLVASYLRKGNVASTMEETSAATQEIAAGMQEVSAAIEEITASTQEVTSMLGSFNKPYPQAVNKPQILKNGLLKFKVIPLVLKIIQLLFMKISVTK